MTGKRKEDAAGYGSQPPIAASKPRVVREGGSVETRVFRSGNSDAVRLPKRWGLEGIEVRVSRLSDGRIILEPKSKRRWAHGFLASLGRVSEDFMVYPIRTSEADEARAERLFDE